MTATQVQSSKNPQPSLYVSFELGWSQWKLAFGTCPGDKARLRTIGARKLNCLQEEFAKAKKRFGLAENAPICSCYEAGRDGFWLHRWLTVRQLLGLRGIGTNSAWLYVMEFFGWRQLRNRREVAALAGLTPTPYQSGDSDQEQGISKAGNRRLRSMAIEIAWCWLRYQPHSALSEWYRRRYGSGKSRLRRIGIVALARKLLVALWRYLEKGEVPAGAETVDWRTKVGGVAEEGV